MFDEISNHLHEVAVEKGFWKPTDNATQEQLDIFMTKQLMMIVSEATEVMEAIRKSHGPEAVADEIADILIRTFDLYAGLVQFEYTNVIQHLPSKDRYKGIDAIKLTFFNNLDLRKKNNVHKS